MCHPKSPKPACMGQVCLCAPDYHHRRLGRKPGAQQGKEACLLQLLYLLFRWFSNPQAPIKRDVKGFDQSQPGKSRIVPPCFSECRVASKISFQAAALGVCTTLRKSFEVQLRNPLCSPGPQIPPAFLRAPANSWVSLGIAGSCPHIWRR